MYIGYFSNTVQCEKNWQQETTNMKLILLYFGLLAIAIADDRAEKLLLESNKLFTKQLFNEVVKNNPGQSLVQSAFSVLSPLALLSLASSEGKSHDELLNVLRLPDDNTTKEVFSLVNSKYRSVKGVDLKLANKLYVADEFQLNPEFAAVSKKVFDSEVENVDFTKNKNAADKINKWVESHTNNRVKDLVKSDDFDEDTRAVLLNTVYFKAAWEKPFSNRSTTEMNYHVSKSKTVKLPFMTQTSSFLYGTSKELDATLLKLLYKEKEASLLVVLPNKVDGLAALTKKLNPALLDKVVKNMQYTEVRVSLPKFKIETKTDLKEVLKNMGVKLVFDKRLANLNKLLKQNNENIYVSKATQKAFIEVNEQGTEAAAGNKFEVLEPTSLVIGFQTFTADRPFYFELRHNETTLFNGVFVQ